MNHFFLCDSPTLNTGFARVSSNLLRRLDLPNMHVWALGYYGEKHNYDNINLYPANINCSWESNYAINNFFNWIDSFRGPAKLWILHDPFRLKKFSGGLLDLKSKGVEIIGYIPVDSYLNPEDAAYIDVLDKVVAYSSYGASEINKICPNKIVSVIPHGYDESFYKIEGVQKAREELFGHVDIETKLIGSVNSNTERKALHRTLETFKYISDSGDYHLYLHCDPCGFYDVKKISRIMGISEKVTFADSFFNNNQIGQSSCPEELLNIIYNCFDLFISTSYGEGWGLTSSEAACCDVPLALPHNTVFKEIYSKDSVIWLEESGSSYTKYNDKLVADIHPHLSAQKIIDFFKNGGSYGGAKGDVQEFEWDTIAESWKNIISS